MNETKAIDWYEKAIAWYEQIEKTAEFYQNFGEEYEAAQAALEALREKLNRCKDDGINGPTMALIDREAALEICEKEYQERLRMLDYCGDTVAWNIGNAIKKIPTIDPIKAAGGCRCRECKHYAPGTEMPCASMDGLVEPDEDGFCSYGEPREAQDDN